MKFGSMMGAAAMVALMTSGVASAAEPLRSGASLPSSKAVLAKRVAGKRAEKAIAKDDHLAGPFAIIIAILAVGAIAGGIAAAASDSGG